MQLIQHRRQLVFSTYVEVIPFDRYHLADMIGVLHVCGGDPNGKISFSSPMLVFSTYVEVIPTSRQTTLKADGVLHVCGGDPIGNWRKETINGCSPRMWR